MSNNIIAKNCKNLLRFYTEILNVNEIVISIPKNKKNYTFQSKNEEKQIESTAIKEKPKVIKALDLAQNIDELQKQLLDFGVHSFQKPEKSFVFGEGNPNADILILGDAPNMDDVKAGKPFKGNIGQLLDQMLSFVNINRQNCYMSNVMFWQNAPTYQFNAQEIEATLSFVHQMIVLIKPKIIVTLGAIATHALLNKPQGIVQLRGKFHSYPKSPEILILPSFHPSALLNTPQNKQLSWRDFLLLKSKCIEMGLYK